MSYVQIEKLLERTKYSLFKLVILATKRTIELSEGAERLVETDTKDPSSISLEEIESGKITIEEITKKEKKTNK